MSAVTEQSGHAEQGIRGAANDPRRSLLRVTTCGSVDDGKSTLIGRLLYDSSAVPIDQMQAVEATSLRRGHEQVDLALLTDGLRAEREQGITIDVAYRYFDAPSRRLVIADAPGHEQYTRNMATAASSADVAIILIDARLGLSVQTRRHALIASILRVPMVVVAVNKCDLVGWDQKVFDRISSEFNVLAEMLGIKNVQIVPIAALHGDNVVQASKNTPWYQGQTLIDVLDNARPETLADAALRLPVQYVIRPRSDTYHDYRGYGGPIVSGRLRVGDEVIVQPAGHKSRVHEIHIHELKLEEAGAPLSVSVTLTDDIDVARGDVICCVSEQPPKVETNVEAELVWMDAKKLAPGAKYLLKQTARQVKAVVDEVVHRVDLTSYERQGTDHLALNDIGRVKIRTSSPIVFDAYEKNRGMGSFVLIDDATGNTVAAGMLV